MSRTTARHEREQMAQLAKALGMSRESLRKLKQQYWQQALEDSGMLPVMREAGMLQPQPPARVGLYVKLPPELRAQLGERAKAMGITQNDLVVSVLSEYLGKSV